LVQQPNSFLAYVARRYSLKAEDVGTDVMAYLLARPSMQAAFKSFLDELGWPQMPSRFRVSCRTNDSYGVPDITLADGKGLSIIIENKFWAGLTSNQPCSYLDSVRPAGFVLFVAPQERKEALWSKILDRCTCAGKSLRLTKSPFVAEASGPWIGITSWEEMLLFLRREISGETELHVFVDQLGRLASMSREDQIGHLDASIIGNKTIARQAYDCVRLAEAIADAANSKDYIKIAERQSQRATGAGWSTKYGQIGRFNAWIGFDARLWAQYGSPLWLGFDDRGDIEEQLQDIFKNEKIQHFVDRPDEDPMLIMPIRLMPNADQEEVIEAALEQLSEICVLLEKPSQKR
jgi:hypothetical protein